MSWRKSTLLFIHCHVTLIWTTASRWKLELRIAYILNLSTISPSEYNKSKWEQYKHIFVLVFYILNPQFIKVHIFRKTDKQKVLLKMSFHYNHVLTHVEEASKVIITQIKCLAKTFCVSCVVLFICLQSIWRSLHSFWVRVICLFLFLLLLNPPKYIFT